MRKTHSWQPSKGFLRNADEFVRQILGRPTTRISDLCPQTKTGEFLELQDQASDSSLVGG